MIFYKQTPEKA